MLSGLKGKDVLHQNSSEIIETCVAVSDALFSFRIPPRGCAVLKKSRDSRLLMICKYRRLAACYMEACCMLETGVIRLVSVQSTLPVGNNLSGVWVDNPLYAL